MTDLIESKPDILGGKPCVKGTRLSVEFILELLASGASQSEILASYPQLNAEGVAAAITYAARGLANEVVWELKVPGSDEAA